MKMPKFKIGDKISPVGDPATAYEIENVIINTDGSGNSYEVITPKGATSTIPAVDIYQKNARSFNRQEAIANQLPDDPDFDPDGFPTFNSDTNS